MKMFPADIWEYPIPKIGNISFRFLGKTLDEIHVDIAAEEGVSEAAIRIKKQGYGLYPGNVTSYEEYICVFCQALF